MEGSPLSPAGGRRQSQTDASTVVARLCADAPVAQRIADFLTELLDPNQTAVGTFEGPRDNWTVEICFRATQDRVSIHDLHATLLHLLGIDHERFAIIREDWK